MGREGMGKSRKQVSDQDYGDKVSVTTLALPFLALQALPNTAGTIVSAVATG